MKVKGGEVRLRSSLLRLMVLQLGCGLWLRVVRLSVGIARYGLVRSTVTCMYMCVYYVFLLLQRRCLINGTTTACYFSTIHLETSKLLADIVGECPCTVEEHTHVCARTHTHTHILCYLQPLMASGR